MDNQPQPKLSKKKLIIIIAIAVAVIGLGVAAYFLFLRPTSSPSADDNSSTDTSESEIPAASSDKPEAERLSDYDKEIALADNDEDRLSLILDNVMVLTDLNHAGEALARLQSIDTTGLGDFDLYRVYSHYAYVYDKMGDIASSNSYHDLADAAYDRYELANGEETE